ncbi:hypothetical protein ATY29_08680 [Rhizobium hidalgonense]|nr:hypothetical protein ATY29_08680 [Rhizobium hidalgonense]
MKPIEWDVFNQSSFCPAPGYGTAGNADPFDRVHRRQKSSAFAKRGDNETGYRSTVAAPYDPDGFLHGVHRVQIRLERRRSDQQHTSAWREVAAF